MGVGRVSATWFWVLWLMIVLARGMGLLPCKYPAIYNFGDSNSDTGGFSATFNVVPPPNGESFFGRPAGRVCDGRLVIDFTAEHLGLPYLRAYLDSLGTNFRQGANFATQGSTIQRLNLPLLDGGYSPFSLDFQVSQFEQFRARTSYLYEHAKTKSERKHLPKPEEFSKALYTFDIGQNDLSAGFRNMSDEQVRASIPKILDQFSIALLKLYHQLGARTFWIHNTGPLGCLPANTMYFGGGPEFLDKNGCIKSHNKIAMEFNTQLKQRIRRLRAQLSHATLTYVDVYTAKYKLINEATAQGFMGPLEICCGHHEDNIHVWCGQKENTSCGNPTMYISWDGIHYSQAANHWVANHLLTGALSDPPVPLAEACHKNR